MCAMTQSLSHGTYQTHMWISHGDMRM